MNQTRTFLLFAWLLVAFLLWEAWQTDYVYPPAAPAAEPSSSQPSVPPAASSAAAVPGVPNQAPDPASTPAAALEADDSTTPVTVTTDVLRLRIDPRGVSVLSAELFAYSQTSAKGASPVQLLDERSAQFFVAQTGWVSASGVAPSHEAVFATTEHDVALEAGSDTLDVPFVWTAPADSAAAGLRIERTLRFKRGEYAIEVRDQVVNGSTAAWQGNAYYQLLRKAPEAVGYSLTNPQTYSFVGAAWYSAAEKFNKIAFDDFSGQQTLEANAQAAWVGMLQHYFFAAWIPPSAEQVQLATDTVGERHLIRAMTPALPVEAGASGERVTRLYIGPKLQDRLAAIAPGLELTVDYGVLTFISEPLHWLLSMFHKLSGNWGVAIIPLVLSIKALFFKLSEAQYRSFAKMRQVQPRIEALKERYGDDRQKFNLAMMELYKKEKINPMGGCLPILVQLPVFFALYWVLLESVELRHAPFVGWIDNLTAPDPYFVLPVLNLATMWLTQKLQPAPGMDPLQRKMMQWMPVVFGVMFAFFPSGLVLYWTVNGGLGLLQQWIITKRFASSHAAS